MRTRAITITAALLLAALTACSSSQEPAPAASSAPPSVSKAEATQQCVDAVAEVITARPADWDDETDTDAKPAECDTLTESEYLDAYMDGLSESNQSGLSDLERQIEEAEENDQP